MGLLRNARDFLVVTWRGDAKEMVSVVRADQCVLRTGPMGIARTTYQNRRRALYVVAGITACGVCVGVGLVSPSASAKLGTLIAGSLGDGEHQRKLGNEPHLYGHSRDLSETWMKYHANRRRESIGRRFRSESGTSSPTSLSLQSEYRESHRDTFEGGAANEETPEEASIREPGASSPRIHTSLQGWLGIEPARVLPVDLEETSEARVVSRLLSSPDLTLEVAGDKMGEVPEGNAGNATRHGFCSSLQVEGLGRCPELGGELLREMLQVKKEMLRQIVDVLSNPASCGAGGEHDEPLLMVQKLAVDEADAAFGAFEPRYLHYATDAAGWSPEPGGFNRWVEQYYREILRKLRPVLVSVHGDDVCAIENELSLEARKAAALKDGMTEEEFARHTVYDLEDFTVPVVLMTLGWDPAGDPTHRQDDHGRDRSCVYRVLEMPRVVRWFTSHTRYDSHTDAVKFRYIPVGFGGYDTRNGLPQRSYLEGAKRQLRAMEKCPVEENGRFDLLFQCNTLDRKPRDKIWKEMTEKEEGPIPINHAPLPAEKMVATTAKGIFSVSPPGTGPDCFRNYEMLLGGTIVMVQETYSLTRIMENLPVFFFGKHEDTGWGTLTCDKLKEMFRSVQAMVQAGKETGHGLAFEKLTHGFWRKYIRDETLKAGGLEPGMTYPERSIAPLNHPGWTSFRKLGCYSRSKRIASKIPQSRQFVLKEGERNPTSCAARCSWKTGGGVGFFGIEGGDLCWCDKEPGADVTSKHCGIACDGDSEHGDVCGGNSTSTVFVFGPEKGLPFEYLGCFRNSYHRVMYHVEVKLRGSNTPYICEALCTSLRLPFFALENGYTCLCGVMPRDSPRSVRSPAFMPGAEGGFKGYDPPDAAFAARPLPQGVRVGDPRFECHKGRCSGDSTMWGCGSMSAYDLYRIVDPCVLYRDC